MPRIDQKSFTSGELAPSLYGRSDIEQYAAGAALLYNMIIHPHGGASNRPGLRMIARADGQGVLLPFEYSTAQTYVLEFTDRKMRVVKDRGLVVFPAGAGTDLVKSGTYKWTPSGNGESEYYLELAAGGDPQLAKPVNVYESSDSEIQIVKSGTYKWIPSAHGTAEYYLQLDAGGNTKLRLPDSVSANGTPMAKAALGSLTAGSWNYGDNDGLGYSTVYVRLSDSVDPDTKAVRDIVNSTAYRWTKSARGINEFYLELKAGGDPDIGEPGSVKEFIPGITGGKLLAMGDVGLLNSGEWAYDDNDALGYDTIYVRLAGTGYADPDYKTAGYLKAYDTGYITALYTPATLSEGVAGSLSAGQWAYGDNDTLGFDTVYVRLGNSGDPDSETDGYVEAGYVVEVASPYAVADLRKIDHAQSADVMFMTHPDYAVKDLTRTGHHAWTITDRSFKSSLASPSGLGKTIVGTLAGSNRELLYYVTSANEKGEESAPSAALSVNTVATWPEGGLVKLTWNSVPGTDHYVVYKNSAGLPGYIGSASANKFTDDNITPDANWGLPNVKNPFSGEKNWPGSVTLYQQRLMFGRTDNAPLTIFGSRNGALNNFNTSTPLQDDDAVEYPLASTQVNEILYFVPMKSLIVITTAGPWALTHGSNSDAITPTSVQADYEGSTPAHRIKPIVIGKSIILMESYGQVVRDMLYDFATNSYDGVNLSVLANHLFIGRKVVDWAYQRSPDSIVWCVMSDGALIGMTYMREHKIWGWHRHETDGFFESVCSIKGADYDEVYFIVRREINGETVRFIELLDKRFSGGSVEDAYFVDCGLTYDGAPATVISGLGHLEGEDVAVLADGNVIPDMRVENGSITLPHAASVVHVGLPYVSDLRTLPLDFSAQAGPMQGRKKNISSISVKLLNSRGGFVGAKADSLVEMKFREDEGYGEPTALFSGDKSESVECSWDTDTAICIRQTDPLPITVLSLSAEVELGDD